MCFPENEGRRSGFSLCGRASGPRGFGGPTPMAAAAFGGGGLGGGLVSAGLELQK